eukprot:5290173-Amphidinium_carterae.1
MQNSGSGSICAVFGCSGAGSGRDPISAGRSCFQGGILEGPISKVLAILEGPISAGRSSFQGGILTPHPAGPKSAGFM